MCYRASWTQPSALTTPSSRKWRPTKRYSTTRGARGVCARRPDPRPFHSTVLSFRFGRAATFARGYMVG